MEAVMQSEKLSKKVVSFSTLFLTLVVVLSSAVSSQAYSGAYSSSGLTNLFISPNAIVSLTTSEGTGISTSPTDFAIGSTTSLVGDSYNFSNTTTTVGPTGVYQTAITSANLTDTFTADTGSFFDVFFDLSVAGDVFASGDFDLFLQAFTDTAAESASGFARASISIFNITQSTSAQGATQELNFYSTVAPAGYLDSLSGLLSTSLQFNSGDSGMVRFMVEGNATAASPVPEPSTFVLFGIGLAAALLRRRARS